MYSTRQGGFFIILLFVAFILCEVSLCASQPIWVYRPGDRAVAWEFLKPNFETMTETSFFTSANFISGRYQVRKIGLVADVPFVHFANDSEYYPYDDSAIGNPYLGLELYPGYDISIELGGRLPLAPDDKGPALMVGGYTDLVDRLEAFVDDSFPLLIALNYFYDNPSGFGIRLRGGSSFLIGTEDGTDNELYLLYAVQTGYWGPALNFSGGISGRFWVTRDGGDLGQRTYHQMVVGLQLARGVVRPGLNFRFPFDEDMARILDWVIGVNVAIHLP